jgi:hypothetical protein
MSLENCKHCGALFIRGKSEFCVNCETIYSEYYRKVRDYLKTHPNSTLWDLHNHTGINISILQYLLKDEIKG